MSKKMKFAALLAGGAMLLAGCSAGETTPAPSSSGQPAVDVSEYVSIAEGFAAPVTEFTGPSEGPAAQADKKIVWITCGFAAEGCNLPGVAAKEAGEALGWDVTVIDGEFNPQRQARAVEEAINAGVDGIVLGAVTAGAIAESVAKARQAGIAVGSNDALNPVSDTGVNFEVIANPEGQGEAVAADFIAKTDGNLRALFLRAPEFNAASAEQDAAEALIAACDTCEVVDTITFTAGESSTRLPEATVSALRQNPEINAIIAAYDAALLETIPALEAAELSDQVLIGAFNGISPALSFVREGRQAATVGGAMEWGAWATLDNLNRIFAGEEPIEQNVPIRLITSDNVDTIEPGAPWTGDFDYKSAYKNIWQIQ